MAELIKLIVGLGNPGPRYLGTRHNAGFMAADKFAETSGCGPWKNWLDIGEYARGALPSGRPVIVAKPGTFMNESGRMLVSFCGYYGILPDEMIVCYDDIALDIGRIRLRRSGSSGGQKGMESIIRQLSTMEIPRLRIGIGPRPEGIAATDFVLAKFSKMEKDKLAESIVLADKALVETAENGLESAMNIFNAAQPTDESG